MTASTLGSVAPTAERRSLALLIVLAAQCMFAMNLLIVVALPRIQLDLGFDAGALTWVLDAFGLAFGGLLLYCRGGGAAAPDSGIDLIAGDDAPRSVLRVPEPCTHGLHSPRFTPHIRG